MTATQLDQLGKALDATGLLVAAVGEGQWEAPTPCTEWNVRQLVSHLVVGNHLFAQALEGDAPPPDEIRRRIDADALGEDPIAAYRAGADAVVAAFGRPGALEQMVTVRSGPYSASSRCTCGSSRRSRMAGISPGQSGATSTSMTSWWSRRRRSPGRSWTYPGTAGRSHRHNRSTRTPPPWTVWAPLLGRTVPA